MLDYAEVKIAQAVMGSGLVRLSDGAMVLLMSRLTWATTMLVGCGTMRLLEALVHEDGKPSRKQGSLEV